MRRLFLHRPTISDGARHLHSAARRHGVTDLCIVKVRKDTKLVARGLHPEWGAVAVKAIDPVASSIHAHSARYTDRIVMDHPTPILPQVHAIGASYSISEWIDGGEIQRLAPDDYHSLPVVEFADSLRSWCTGFQDGAPLETERIVSILKFYIETTVRRMSYRKASYCLSACARFLREEARLGGFIDEMVSLAPQLALQETPMLSDVHAANLIYSRDSNRIVLVDFEALRPGHYLFDLVFCLASLMISGLPRAVTARLAHHLFSEDRIPPGAPVEFFRRFASYVVATYMIIDGHPRSVIEGNLEAIRSAGT